MSSTCKAIVCTAAGQAEVQDLPIPRVRDGHILVRTKAVALNPTDWKSIDNAESIGNRIGCDYAGVVEEIGQNAVKEFKKGDRVCGFVFGALGPESRHHPEDPSNTVLAFWPRHLAGPIRSMYPALTSGQDGWLTVESNIRGSTESAAFGEYLIAKADLAIKVPENLAFEEAATLGVGLTTVGQGLYQSLKLPFPDSPLANPVPILIYGGSTATGILGIQFAKLSGLIVITTSSPRNFDYLKSLGADTVYDYHKDTETLAQEIKAATKNKLTLSWDCSPTEDSARLCALAMSDSESGKYSSLLRIDAGIIKTANPRVESESTLGYSAFGETFSRYGMTFEAKPEDREFAGLFWELSRGLLADGRIKVAKMAIDQGGKGLDGVLKGLDDLKQGRVSGTKLVYRL